MEGSEDTSRDLQCGISLEYGMRPRMSIAPDTRTNIPSNHAVMRTDTRKAFMLVPGLTTRMRREQTAALFASRATIGSELDALVGHLATRASPSTAGRAME